MNPKAEKRIREDLEVAQRAINDALENFGTQDVEQVIGALEGTEERIRRVVACLYYFRR